MSGAEWGYRGRLTLTLRARGGTWIGGLHPFDDASRVFALEECAISDPMLVAAWHAVRAVARGLPEAGALRLAFRRIVPSDHDAASAVVLVVIGGTVWPESGAWAAALLRAHRALAAIWWECDDGERQALAVRGDSHAVPRERADDGGVDSQFLSSPTDDGPQADEALAFAQVNAEVALALRAYVLQRVETFAPSHVVDGYAGVGVLSELLQQAGIRVTAIEADLAGAAEARKRLRGYVGTQVIADTVEEALASVLPADVVVLNPPRRGVDVRVTALLATAATLGVRGIVYVSCDPATLARDVARLPSWRIAALRCFDMFPQTAHVETVCVLVPEAT